MRSPRHSIPASSCAAQPNASTLSTCSAPDPSARDTSARLASVPIRGSLEGGAGHSRRRRRRRRRLRRRGGVVVLCRMRMPCRLLCWAWRGTLRFCDVLCGMGRSCRLMMICGSPCEYCAFSLSLSLPLSLPHSFCVWFSCPRLKFISTTLGSILPSPNSHVRVSSISFPHGGGQLRAAKP